MKENFRKNVVDFAMIQLEKRYVWDAKGPDEFDDSGFVSYIYQELFGMNLNYSGYGIDDTTKQMTNDIGVLRKYQENDPNKEKYLEDIELGDLVFFHVQDLKETSPSLHNHFPGHVGIYLGDKKFIHASSEDGKVVISVLGGDWLKILVASRDVISGILPKID